jgi:hypothetical protein
VDAIDANEARAVVAEVSPRQSWLTRPPVANVSLVVVALAVDQPAFDPDQASRFLLTAERTGLDVQLVLTKVDLVSAEALTQLCERLRGWGYDPASPLERIRFWDRGVAKAIAEHNACGALWPLGCWKKQRAQQPFAAFVVAGWCGFRTVAAGASYDATRGVVPDWRRGQSG